MAPDWTELAGRLASACPTSEVSVEFAMGSRTTYRVGGGARVGIVVNDIDEVANLAAIVSGDVVPTVVIGRGSNLLVAEQGFEGVAIVLGPAFAYGRVADATVSAGAAEPLPKLARTTVGHGLTGFEWAVGVPGSVGGAVRMNAGGHGADIAGSLRSVVLADLVTGAVTEIRADDLELSYRSSNIAPHQVVLEATFDLVAGDPQKSQAQLSEIVRWRLANQPGGQNAGSVFTNPAGDSAGRLIDAAGGKGLRVGSANVSEKHANFVQAEPDGSSDDILLLMKKIRSLVRDHSGVLLNVETRLVGFSEDATRALYENSMGEV